MKQSKRFRAIFRVLLDLGWGGGWKCCFFCVSFSSFSLLFLLLYHVVNDPTRQSGEAALFLMVCMVLGSGF